MSELFVWPEEAAIPFPGKANLLDVATTAGIGISHLCGGRARCSTCRVRIMEGGELLSPRTDAEQAMAERLDFPEEVRLACQTEAEGAVKLWRLVLDQVDIDMASQLGEGHYVGPVGREVEAAVMFVDVAGFTSMSEHLPAYDVVHILNRFFNRAGAAVEGNGGVVDNYLGDGLLALFGVHDEPEPALSAVKAAFGICEAASNMSTYLTWIYNQPFHVRVGIGLGDVIFGLMGDESSARETVIGDVVNTASRLEAANKTTGTTILVTDAIKMHTDTHVEYGRHFDLDLRGKDGHVLAHEPISLIEAEGAPQETS